MKFIFLSKFENYRRRFMLKGVEPEHFLMGVTCGGMGRHILFYYVTIAQKIGVEDPSLIRVKK